MPLSSKPTVAFFDFACCEGCQLTVLQLDERLLSMVEHVRPVTWREVMTEKSEKFDIAFCEGSIASQRDMDRIKRIRNNAGILVSLGACASVGCHNGIKNQTPRRLLLDTVYGTDTEMDSIPARPITAVTEVDYQVQGCPVSLSEFVTVFKHILTGKPYRPPNQPVCVECKLNDYLCVYEKGMICLGPVTRCGCNAICTSRGEPCYGCRGFIDDANPEAMLKVFDRDKLHGIMAKAVEEARRRGERIPDKLALYNNRLELAP